MCKTYNTGTSRGGRRHLWDNMSGDPFLLGKLGAAGLWGHPLHFRCLALSWQPLSQPPIPAELGTPHAWLLGDSC